VAELNCSFDLGCLGWTNPMLRTNLIECGAMDTSQITEYLQ
jgi:hypothetical protein